MEAVHPAHVVAAVEIVVTEEIVEIEARWVAEAEAEAAVDSRSAASCARFAWTSQSWTIRTFRVYADS